MMQGNFISGSQYLFRGFKLMMQPGLKVYVIIPFIINFIIFASLFGWVIQELYTWIELIMSWLPGFLDFIRWVIWPMIIIFLLSISAYGFSILANIIASPFNSLLAEKAEEHLTGIEVAGNETIGQALLAFPKGIGREVQKLLYYIPLAIAALIITFIPAINIISPVVWFLLGSWMMAIQYCDYPMDNRNIHFKTTRKVISERRLSSNGFGMTVMAGTMIPIINLIIMPAAICGAAIFWAEELQHSDSLQ